MDFFQLSKIKCEKGFGIFYSFPLKLGFTIFFAFFALFVFSLKIQGQTAIVPINTSSPSGRLTAKERNEIFEEVWQLINERYYDAKFHNVDWNSVRKKYQPRVAEIADDNDFYALLDRMVGELRDSHTRVYSPSQREQQLKQRRTSVGITIRKIEGKFVVISVAPDSEAARKGIKAGMIVRKVEGEQIERALAKAGREIGTSSSERSTEMRAYSKILAGAPETILQLELIDRSGKTLRLGLRRETLASKPNVSVRLLDSGIVYLKFSGFLEPLENEIKAALEKYKSAPAMILDLRNNGGGDGEMGLRFAGAFFDRKITVASLVTRNGKPPIPEMPMILQTGSDAGTQIYSNPLAVLINEGTASTAELITNAFQEQNRATIFGTQSCGCVLGFMDYIKLKGGGFLTMSEFGFVTPKNRTLEGTGVTPDKIVSPTLDDIANERDVTLAQAQQYLKESLKLSK